LQGKKSPHWRFLKVLRAKRNKLLALSAALAFSRASEDTNSMDTGEVIYMVSRLVLGALASFFAILLWSKTRDIPWMLMVMGTIAAYAETVYSILEIFGIAGTAVFVIGSVPAASILFPNLPTVFFLSAFVIMVVRKYRHP
jgi:hypothetical protein